MKSLRILTLIDDCSSTLIVNFKVFHVFKKLKKELHALNLMGKIEDAIVNGYNLKRTKIII